MASNIKFRYLYRDGSNFKRWGEIVFANPSKISSYQMARILRKEWGEGGLFVAHEIRIPEVFLYDRGTANADDHCFHELFDVQASHEPQTDEHGRTTDQFITEVRRKSGMWEVFDPFERWLRAGIAFAS